MEKVRTKKIVWIALAFAVTLATSSTVAETTTGWWWPFSCLPVC